MCTHTCSIHVQVLQQYQKKSIRTYIYIRLLRIFNSPTIYLRVTVGSVEQCSGRFTLLSYLPDWPNCLKRVCTPLLLHNAIKATPDLLPLYQVKPFIDWTNNKDIIISDRNIHEAIYLFLLAQPRCIFDPHVTLKLLGWTIISLERTPTSPLPPPPSAHHILERTPPCSTQQIVSAILGEGEGETIPMPIIV